MAVGNTLVLVLGLLLIPSTALSSDRIYSLSAPLALQPDSEYIRDEPQPPAPRRGLVIHGYVYDAMSEPDWVSAEQSSRALKCGDKLRLPDLTVRSRSPGEPLTAEFWLIHSAPEALFISRHMELTVTKDCAAKPSYSLKLSRLLFNAGQVTALSWENDRWSAPETLPTDGRYSYPGDKFLPVDDLASLRKRYRKTTYREALSALPSVKTLCFGTGNMIDTSQQCHLDMPGPYRGLRVSSYMFHTMTYDRGMRVDFLDTNAIIDGRLFEWDREIGLTPSK